MNSHYRSTQGRVLVMAEEAGTKETVKKIKGAKLVTFPSPLAHYAVFRGPNKVKGEVTGFFKEIGIQWNRAAQTDPRADSSRDRSRPLLSRSLRPSFRVCRRRFSPPQQLSDRSLCWEDTGELRVHHTSFPGKTVGESGLPGIEILPYQASLFLERFHIGFGSEWPMKEATAWCNRYGVP
jgi:hypothetical protein